MNSDKIEITLTKEEKELCAYLEVFMYYLY